MKGFARTLIIAAVSLGAVGAAPGAADPPPAPVEPLQLSLGDSWAFGFGGTTGEGGYVAGPLGGPEGGVQLPSRIAVGERPAVVG
jgi:hypothetical protein